MILAVRVVAGAGRKRVTEEDGRFKVYLTKPAHEGLANIQLIELLAGHFHVKKYLIKIIRGHKSRDKLVEIDAGSTSAS